ncbi:RpiB/LacA/LacB family sugar-phosphate isomerase, partial [Kibdelosporangium lantanae]
MRVYLGSDHAGYELKTYLVQHLTAAGHEVVDVGPHVYDPEDDYPPYCIETARRTVDDSAA